MLTQKMSRTFKSGLSISLAFLFFILMSAGCASTRTTKTETTVTSTDTTPETTTTTQASSTQNVEKKETTVTTEEKPKHEGVIGTTFHVIGYIIALPFTIIAGLLKIIF